MPPLSSFPTSFCLLHHHSSLRTSHLFTPFDSFSFVFVKVLLVLSPTLEVTSTPVHHRLSLTQLSGIVPTYHSTTHSNQIHLLTSIDACANGPQAEVTEFRRAAFCVLLSKSFMLLVLIDILYNAHHSNPTHCIVFKIYWSKNMDWSNLFETISHSLFIISYFILFVYGIYINHHLSQG